MLTFIRELSFNRRSVSRHEFSRGRGLDFEKLEDRQLLTADFGFAASFGSPGIDIASDVASDSTGNIYSIGYFSGTVDFDPGPGTFHLSSAGSFDVYVSKLDAAGNLVYAKRLGGAGDDRGIGIDVDGAGNVFTTGSFQSTSDFDPGPGTFNLTSAGSEDMFVSKLDSSGNFAWAKRMGGTSHDGGISVVVDGAGNVHTAGKFFGTADFDPGPGTFNLTSAGAEDIIVSKLDSAGDFVYAKRMGGPAGDQPLNGSSLTLDGAGNVYTTGYFTLTADFDPGPATFNLTSAGAVDIFVSKLDSTGNLVYARGIGGASSDAGVGIAVDGSENIYVAGGFRSTVDFDPGPGTYNLTSLGDADIFVLKLDALGDFVLARQQGGAGFDQGNDIVLDAAGNIYTVGPFSGTADFDPGAGTLNLTSAGGTDTFISKLDVNGNLVFADAVGGPLGDGAAGLVLDDSEDLLITGTFWGTVDFDPGPATFNLTSVGNSDPFVLKLTQNTPPVAVDDNYGVNEDGTLIVSALDGVLANDADADFDPLVVTNVVSGPANGILTLNTDGSFTYVPFADFNGTDAFEYQISDGNGGTSQATATITVLSAESQIGAIGYQIQDLVDSEVLNRGQGNALLAKLGAAARALEREQNETAINQLSAFINQMDAFIDSGLLTDLLGNPLIAAAQDAIESAG